MKRNSLIGKFHIRGLRQEFNTQRLNERTQLQQAIVDTPELEEYREIAKVKAGMLMKGGRFYECSKCGGLVVEGVKTVIKWDGYYRKYGYVCFCCRHNVKPPSHYKKNQKALRKLKELYWEFLHEGVKVYKMA